MLKPNELYNLSDKTLDQMIKKTAMFFQAFSEDHRNLEALQKAIMMSNNAVEQARENLRIYTSFQDSSLELKQIKYNDLAFCLRKYASIIIRDVNDTNRYTKAKTVLEECIKLYDFGKENKEEVEIQRALHQLRKVAYELKDGALLKTTVQALFQYVEMKKDNFTLGCYESFFHLAFAEHNYDDALHYTNQALALIKQASKKEGGSESFTYYRHQAKIELAKLESLNLNQEEQVKKFNEIETIFWKAYDGHKELKKRSFDKSDQNIASLKLFKDLIFLFSLRCKKTMLGMDNVKKPKEYVLNQARQLFGRNSSYYKDLTTILDEKIIIIKQKNYLFLDYQFFELNNPPMLVIPPDRIELLFPDSSDSELKLTDRYDSPLAQRRP